MTRIAILLVATALGLSGCDPSAGSPQNEARAEAEIMEHRGGIEISFGDVALLEEVGPDGHIVAYEDGSRAVILNFTLTNTTSAPISANDFPAVQLFDQDGGAWTPDMYFVPGPDGDFTNEWPTELAVDATMQGAAIFTIPAEDWIRDGWAAGWRASDPSERTPLALTADR